MQLFNFLIVDMYHIINHKQFKNKIMKRIIIALALVLSISACTKEVQKPEVNKEEVHKIINSKKIS